MNNVKTITTNDEYTQEVSATGPVAELRGVSKNYDDVQAVKNIDLSIAPGEFLSFLGPSGCGKTTALRMLAGFETPSEGTVLIDSKDVSGFEAYQRPVNMVFQSYALFPHLTVGQNIAYGLKQQRPKLARGVIADKVQRVLETVRLNEFQDRRIWEMSGGQQQRVALARAIVNEPKLLLLDEPLAALDRKLRKEMQIELQDLQRQLGITFVLVTHDQEEALSLSDRICVMRAGEIVQVGTPRDLYDHPQSRYVADFVGTSNFFEGQITTVEGKTGRISLADGETYDAVCSEVMSVGEAACVSIRPEQVRMSSAQAAGSLNVTIQNRIFLGEHTEYLVRHAQLGNIAVMTPRQSDNSLDALQKGDTAWIHWNPDAALILKNT
ncbi:spermidine/putrescine ABC transporter ATP-binding protein [Sulfitobacter sp. SK012]|uniref:ABC transporter ATP-binding protein n=1 Tax=Sulfitobacter sp. SK012 TaxID=1389005 RepID=UPI000E0BA510|nr:ABC transporter ATP-binding protein [Sulfitobacter sp. SK012]AXI48558.1 spermidine/putrescine ABC transporter ATP-binding protein [Sulfitobacter sp. SK012]